MRRIQMLDVTLSGAALAPGYGLTVGQQVQVARRLARLGVDVIEAGAWVASPTDMAGMKAVAAEVRGPVIAAMARPDRPEIEACFQAIKLAARPRIRTYLRAAGDQFEAVRTAREAVGLARRLGAEVEFAAGDPVRSDWRFLTQLYTVAARAGAAVLTVADPAGQATPKEFHDLVRHLMEHVDAPEGVVYGVHARNDLGLAVANTLAGLEAGAVQAACAVNGLGERAGTAALEEVAMALRNRRERFGLETGLRLGEIRPVSDLLQQFTGVSLPPSKAVVGANVAPPRAGEAQPEPEATRDESIAEVCRLESFQVVAGNQAVPTATVRLVREGRGARQEAASGDGPVDALYNAIDRAAGFAGALVDYRVKAVIGGPVALGEVTVRVRSGERVETGSATSADLIEASARAYLQALNKLLSDVTETLYAEPAPGWQMRAWGD